MGWFKDQIAGFEKLLRERASSLVADALYSFAGASALGLILASLAQAGIVTMGAAIFELSVAFGILTFATLVAPIGRVWRIGIVGAFAVAFLSLGYFEYRNFAPPLTTKDIKTTIDDRLAKDLATLRSPPQLKVPLLTLVEGNFDDVEGNMLARPMQLVKGDNTTVKDNFVFNDSPTYDEVVAQYKALRDYRNKVLTQLRRDYSAQHPGAPQMIEGMMVVNLDFVKFANAALKERKESFRIGFNEDGMEMVYSVAVPPPFVFGDFLKN